ncbi:hypothetical protein K0M31_009386 [Melipona bicolor]|uniref:Uncharacterized protein n=1 Tax=Melipona bicolor TaxID=60889 RepID=A0AA40FNL5_9HYME|nr:hypothetical protein K0M31_009386 [Melipona bicolor]
MFASIAFDELIVVGQHSGLNEKSRKTGLFLEDKVRVTSPVSGTGLVKLVFVLTQSHSRVVLPNEETKDTPGDPPLYLIPRFHGYFIIENLGHSLLYSRWTTESRPQLPGASLGDEGSSRRSPSHRKEKRPKRTLVTLH